MVYRGRGNIMIKCPNCGGIDTVRLMVTEFTDENRWTLKYLCKCGCDIVEHCQVTERQISYQGTRLKTEHFKTES